MESITVGGLTFRWTENTLLITTPVGQHLLNGRAAADLLVFLDANRDEIFTVEQVGEVPVYLEVIPGQIGLPYHGRVNA